MVPSITLPRNEQNQFDNYKIDSPEIALSSQKPLCYRGKSTKSMGSAVRVVDDSQTKPKIMAQKSSPLLFYNTIESISITKETPLVTIQQLREAMNSTLDQLVAQINESHANSSIKLENKQSTAEDSSLLLIKSESQTQIPLSAPISARNFSPSHVSFSSFKTYKNN